MFGSLRARLLFTYLLVAGVVLALIGIGLFIIVFRNPLPGLLVYQRLETVAKIVSNRSSGLLQQTRPGVVTRSLSWLDQAASARAVILGSDGEILADSRPDTALYPPEELASLASMTEPGQSEMRDTSGARWLVVSHPLHGGNTLLLASPRAGISIASRVLREFFPSLLWAGGAALMVSLVLAWLISRWVAAPLQRMSKAAKAVAQGSFQSPPAESGPDEVQSLARSFDHMVHQVQSSQLAQRDFVANVSHELKTPLTSIQGFAQAVLDGTAGDDTTRKHAAQVIYDEAERLRRLVDGLLDLARLDSGQAEFTRRPVDLEALLRNVAERLGISAGEKQVQIRNELSPLPAVVADGDRLAQVFTNLIDNAIKHTLRHGHVTLRSDTAGGWISIHVDDSGPGIPDDELSRIFERFYQLDKARPGGQGRGAGLGLAISREIIQIHGGRLVAQSEIGKGSRFTVQLPIVRPDDETMAQSRPSVRL